MEKPADELEFIKTYVTKLQAERGNSGGDDGRLKTTLIPLSSSGSAF